MSKYLAGVVIGFILGAVAILPLNGQAAQRERQLPENFQPYILSENVQRIARDEQIWRGRQFQDVESYVDFLALADSIAKRRIAEQARRLGHEVNLDEEYRATFGLLCFLPIPGKPPRYSEALPRIRADLAVTDYSLQQARQAALRRIKPAIYQLPATGLMQDASKWDASQFFILENK